MNKELPIGEPIYYGINTPRCAVSARHTGQPCRQPAMANGKCRFHGGKSTGPKTPEGLAKSRRANWRHGDSSAQAKAAQKQIRLFFRQAKAFLDEISK